MSLSEKRPTASDSASETPNSVPQSVSEKHPEREAELGTPPPDDSLRSGRQNIAASAESDPEITRIRTSGDDVEYPTGVKLNLISFALCLAVFLIALDNTIIATAIPKITDQFHSLPDVGWYGSAYMLTTACCQLLFGKFYTFFSIKTVFLVAIAIFELGSLVCATAPNSIALIMGRAIAGLGSAGIFSGALIIVAHSVPLAKRPIYSGMIGSMYGIASIAGPLLGGVFTTKATWRWCFYINLPIGAITIVVLTIFFIAPRQVAIEKLGFKARVLEFDIYGTALFIPGIISLLLALQWGGTKYAWESWRIILLFCFFGVLIIGFTAVQFWKQETATIPPKMMKQRTMWAAALFSFCIGSAFLLLIYFLPIWFQAVKGASAVHSGIMNLPMVLSQVLFSILAGAIVTMTGYYAPVMIVSSLFTAVGAGLLSTLKSNSDHSYWMGYQCILGIGVGLGMQQPLMAVQTVLDISQVPVGTSIVIFAQILGGALFVSIGENVFTNQLVQDLAKYAPSIDPKVVLSTGATSIQSTLNKAVLPGVTLAYNNAVTYAFMVAAIIAAFTILGSGLIEWRSMKGKKVDAAAAP